MNLWTSGWKSGPGTTIAVAILIAAIYYGIEHLPDASTRPDYAPDAETMGAAFEQVDVRRRLGVLALAALGAAGLWFGRAEARWNGGLVGTALAAFTVLPFFSVLWSDAPGVTIRRSVVFGLSLWAAAGLCRLLSGRQLVWAALVAVCVQFGVGLLTELFLGTFRPWESDYRFAGTIHPNMQALQLGVGVVASAVLLLRPGRRGGRWSDFRGPLLCAVAAALLLFCLLTKSRTSVGGVIAAVAAVAVFLSSGPTKNLLAIGGVGLAGAVIVVLLLTGLDPTDDIRDAAMMGRSEDAGSLSGRVQIWDALDPYVADRPLLGYGYLTFWSERRLYALHSEVGFKFAGAHSAWYETALGLGIPGAILLATILLGGMSRAASAELAEQRVGGTGGSPLPAFLFGVLALAALNSLLEAIIADVRLTTLVMYCGLGKATFFPDARSEGRRAD
ncbi:O-antigen ligase family protein [Alienimonas chondri]|uniref:O-antigen ligase-related domain-containing protein n=1 Tax=Alienimonas chondri TaxID=2681879 RepID=A0ABX1V9F3_9PLAN|nr:O-antigen ligase family protein [Alienimonas chondri]NNJ24551.1 hypothetical protein [Alienimonas chondri]